MFVMPTDVKFASEETPAPTAGGIRRIRQRASAGHGATRTDRRGHLERAARHGCARCHQAHPAWRPGRTRQGPRRPHHRHAVRPQL